MWRERASVLADGAEQTGGNEGPELCHGLRHLTVYLESGQQVARERDTNIERANGGATRAQGDGVAAGGEKADAVLLRLLCAYLKKVVHARFHLVPGR